MNVNSELISDEDKKIITRLLAQTDYEFLEETDVWNMVNLVWDELGCDSRNLDSQKIRQFYDHPVWIINGLFIENHNLSMQHRASISNWINKNNLRRVLDFGGGIGTLGILIAKGNAETLIDIYEPYKNDFAMSRTKEYSNIHFVKECDEQYDCILAIDVLEHVPNPLLTLFKIAEFTKHEGFFIVANCFFPVVKCHLPSSFHLRYSFDFFAKLMGFVKLGVCEGSHALIYQKRKAVKPNWWKIRIYEKLSRFMFPICKVTTSLRKILSGA